MKIFGLLITTNRHYEAEINYARLQGESNAIRDIRTILQQKDKVYLEPIELIGNGHTISDCAFIGSMEPAALSIKDR